MPEQTKTTIAVPQASSGPRQRVVANPTRCHRFMPLKFLHTRCELPSSALGGHRDVQLLGVAIPVVDTKCQQDYLLPTQCREAVATTPRVGKLQKA
eukprot:3194557-Amphidinium_carterae.1